MKRTRRIEVVRYTRRVSVIRGGSAPVDPDVSPAIDITPAAPEGENRERGGGEAVGPQTPRRGTAFRLRDLLRPRR